MPMFDDPKKELQWLQEQLLAEEAEEVSGEDWLREDTPSDFEEELDDIIRLIGEDQPVRVSRETAYRNYANNYGRSPVEEPVEEADALYTDEYESPEKKKEKGIRGLVFLAILETLGIVAIAAWWVKFLWL